MTRTTAFRVTTCSAPMAGKAPIEPIYNARKDLLVGVPLLIGLVCMVVLACVVMP